MADQDPTLDHVLTLVGYLTDLLAVTHRRALALQHMLARHGVVSEQEVEAEMKALDEAGTLEAAYAPEYEEIRRIREWLRRHLGEPDRPA